MNKNFNLIITGVGGQGLVTLGQIIGEAAFLDGYDVRSSELHGLSQRGGTVLSHIRFGKKVFSPLVKNGKADLIIGLEALEGLRASDFGNKNTNFLINKYFSPFLGGLPFAEIENKLQKIAGKNLHLIPASALCKEKLQNEVVGSIFLLGYAVNKNLIPIKKESMIAAISKIIPDKYLELNKKAFNLAVV